MNSSANIAKCKEDIKKAREGVEKAQAVYDKALAKYKELKVAYEEDYRQNHPNACIADVDKYLDDVLKDDYKRLALDKELLILKVNNLAWEKENLEKLLTEKVIVTPEEILKELFGFDMGVSQAYSTPLNGLSTNQVSDVPSLMKFVCRKGPSKTLYQTVDDYLHWHAKKYGEAEKNIKFITVVGTSGNGKTTFARRFLEMPYTGNYPDIINDCKNSNRNYRLDCSWFDLSRDADTQLALFLLYEAFKHLVQEIDHKLLLDKFFDTFPNSRIKFYDTLKVITDVFCLDSSLPNEKRLVFINLDETNVKLECEKGKEFLKRLVWVLGNAAGGFCIVTILSGNRSTELFHQFQISSSMFVDIDLPLIRLKGAKEVILGMTSNPSGYSVSSYLEYLLSLCGGVGKYLELVIIQMSIMGQGAMDGTAISGFKLDAYEYFMKNLQTREHIKDLLDKLLAAVLAHYPGVFSEFAGCIELLAWYTLFQWRVLRNNKINGISIEHLENSGLVFLDPVPNGFEFQLCTIPFIILYWLLNNSHHNVELSLLKHIKGYFSSDESENEFLYLVIAKLWGLTQINDLKAGATGYCSIMLSELVNLRFRQPDVYIKFRPDFTVVNAPKKIDLKNYKSFQSETENIAFLNVKGASFVDAFIYSEPMIGIQEKTVKKRRLDGMEPAKVNQKTFDEKRVNFPADDIFLVISDEEPCDIVLGDKDVFIKDFANSGPLIALRQFVKD